MSMRNPSHPGELIRESIQAKSWTVAQCAERLGVNPKYTVATAKRTRRSFAHDGAGVGTYRME